MKTGKGKAQALRAVGLLPALLAAGIVQAQDAAAAPAEQATRLEAVEVTGSRIKKSEGEGDSPVLVLTAADLKATGITSIGDIIQRLGVSGSSLNTRFNSAGNFGFPSDGGGVGSGSTTISLRNLGAQRTLVLVDGLRWVNESSASGVSGAVDLNTIPFSAIERVEILTDGASSLYGSDAIGGVVNIITKKSQKGGLANIYYGDYQTGNGETYTGNLSLGVKEKQYEFFVDLSHYQQREISSSATEQSSFPIPGTGTAFGSSSTPTGRFVFFPNGNNTNGGLCPLTDTNGDNVPDTAFCNITPNGVNSAFPGQYHGFTNDDRFNFSPFNFLLTPSRRSALFAQGRYKINDDIRLSLKGLYQSRKSVNQAAPEPVFIGPGAGTGGLADTVGIDVSNPFNPFGYSLDPGSNLVFAARRPVEGGPRVFTQNVDTRYFSASFDGSFDLFDRFFAWDVNYANAVNAADQTINGTYNIRRIAQALGPVANCTAPCVPLNFFGGPGTITPDQLAYISFIERDSSRQTLDTVSLNLSGSVLPLPAGSLDFAAGYEHRKLSGSYSPDAVVVAGESNGVPSLPTSGRYSIDELYLELAVPLLAKLPLAKRLDLSFATRYSDYTTFGSTVKSKVGLRWQPITDLTLRGNYAEGFRAPSIGESFGSPARFDASIEDPCSGATGATATTCQNVFGTPVGFQQANTQISIRTGGNANLDAETSRSYTAGLVYSPSWAEKSAWSDRVDLELTFYKHRINNAIQSPDAQTQLNRCVASGDPNSSFCSGISRGTSGDINGFDSTLRNLGRLSTQGYDLGIGWVAPRSPYGKFTVNWQATYTEFFRAVSTDTGLEEPRGVGTEVSDSGIPRWKSTVRANWELAPFTAGWTVRYLSALVEQCGDAVDFASCGNPDNGTNRLDAIVYHDLQAGVKLPIPYAPELSAGVNNVFSAGPPICVSCSLNGYDASNYDIAGRFAYVQAVVKF
ncbi:TonB-dependent siderophore receptor [Nevskia sp.]|uniref:TonB-dependent receptor plug domain-containing protein n=1 Tax=Nevskia sp. TaxID=1929292 RepID=UPI0025CE67A5|nr:TonB-dependent receptor [Nevskia sp.]